MKMLKIIYRRRDEKGLTPVKLYTIEFPWAATGHVRCFLDEWQQETGFEALLWNFSPIAEHKELCCRARESKAVARPFPIRLVAADQRA